MEKATFAMGCFWGVERLFYNTKGVTSTRVGYTGGSKENPTYHDLGDHTESVELEFDPKAVSYKDLVHIFFENHDYKSKAKIQYKSAVFYHSQEQSRIAEEIKPDDAATEILPATEFWPAEDYHQKYLEKRGIQSCHI